MGSSHQGIDIASYLADIEKIVPELTQSKFTGLISLAKKLVKELRRELDSKEDLMKIGTQMPLLEPSSFEAIMWALAILTSAWTNWVFSAKANDPQYNSEKPEASMNAKKVLPYIKKIILVAMIVTEEIGKNPENNYRPENIRKLIHVEN